MEECNESEEFTVASVNFGGAEGVVPVVGGAAGSRLDALAQFISNPTGGVGSSPCLCVVAGIQEQTRLTEPTDDSAESVRKAIRPPGQARFFYVPAVTTDWHPLYEKWRSRREQEEAVSRMEQGMATYTKGEIALADPWVDLAKDRALSQGLVVDLPVVEFLTDVEAEDERKGTDRAGYGRWTTPDDGFSTSGESSTNDLRLRYRHTYYRGDRDNEPRRALAHRVWLGDERWQENRPQFVFLNVHLTSLKAEDTNETDTASGGVPRTTRGSILRAQFLRYLQLGVISDFTLDVYRELKLPVIVVGDLNASIDAPEIEWFKKKVGMKSVFDGQTCWKCGGPYTPCSLPKPYYALPDCRRVLTRTRSEFRRVTGESPKTILVKECCSKCGAEHFTHKRNFGLIDNILYTAPPDCVEDTETKSRLEVLRWRLEPSPTEKPYSGIRLDTYFSDHLPVWCRFRIRERSS